MHSPLRQQDSQQCGNRKIPAAILWQSNDDNYQSLRIFDKLPFYADGEMLSHYLDVLKGT
jgi:hypothetical protein